MERSRKRRISVLLSLILTIVITSFAVWVSPLRCKLTPRRSREAVLRQNLDTLRRTIDAYTYDKRKAPKSLHDLVTAGYIKEIPRDPITCEPNWNVVIEDTIASIGQIEPGINDVRSASEEISTKDTAYNTW